MLSWCLFLNRNFNRRRELPTRARIIVSLKHDTIELLYWMTYELCSSSIIIQLCQQRTHSECSQPLTDNTVVQWHTSCSATTTTIYIKYTAVRKTHFMRIKLFTNTYTESLVKIIKTYTKASTTIHTPYCTLTTNTISLSICLSVCLSICLSVCIG